MKIAAYVRVSTEKQSDELQRDAISSYVAREWPDAAITWFADVGSGATAKRLGLEAIKARQVKGLILWKLDRCFRSTRHLADIAELCRSRKVALVSVTEPAVDTTTPQGQLLFTILGAMAQFERDLIAERVREGIAAARRRGKRIGRRRISVDVEYARLLLAEGHSVASAARAMRITRTTLTRYLAAG